ncbi:MAG: putative quinol monooxygenase [Pseudomonadota bacterium]
MIVVEGTIRVRDIDAARPHMLAMIAASRQEDGCIDYAYALDLTDPGLVRVHERWRDRNALNRHLDTEHLKAWRSAWDDIGVTDRSLRLYEAEAEAF